MELVNVDGVPDIPDAASAAQLQLLNLIEDHTMTFLDPGEGEAVERADAFYNQSPEYVSARPHTKTT